MSKRLPYSVPTDAPDRPPIWRTLAEKKADPAHVAEKAAQEPGVQLGDLVPLGRGDARVGRRNFLAVGGATAAAVGLSGCLRRPTEHILPYSRAPEYVVPGVPLHYATAIQHQGASLGLLVESHTGRPTKIEGNPDHPGSGGGTDAIVQGMILDLYDPERSSRPRQAAEGGSARELTWSDFEAWWREKAGELEANGGGRGLRVLAPPSDSPSFQRMRGELLSRFPSAQLHTWSAVGYGSAREGARLAFGQPLSAEVDYARARTIVALDCDFLGGEPGSVRAQRRFAQSRRLRRPSDQMSRLYVVEGTLSLTGINADNRLRLAPSQIDRFLRALAAKLGTLQGVQLPPAVGGGVGGAAAEGFPQQWVDVVAQELADDRGRSAIVVGWRQPPHVHALAHALNMALGNLGATVSLFPPLDPDEPDHGESLRELTTAMSEGQVDTLVMLGGNPVYDAPADLGFAEALARVGSSVHLSDRVDETSAVCTWHLPKAHPLESWGDHRGTDGTVAIQQPLIAPLLGGRSDLEVLGILAGARPWRGYQVVRRTLQQTAGGASFDRVWRRSLHRGVVVGTAPTGSVRAPLQDSAVGGALRDNAPAEAGQWEVVFMPSYQVGDGAHLNNPYLLEMPDPVTKLVWDNAAYISPEGARQLGLDPERRNPHGDLLTISREGTEPVTIPAFVLPGHADNVITLPLGFGRRQIGRYGEGVGFDVYPVRTSDALGFATDVTVRASGGRHELVQTQDHHSMEGRPLAIDATIEQYRRTPDFPDWREGEQRPGTPTPSIGPLWTQVDYTQPRPPAQGGQSYSLLPTNQQPRPGAPPRYKWGFVVDLSTCTGCSACVVACNTENNIAVVGKRQVALGREMHWMRVDRYFVGEDVNEPQTAVQPVACQHCEEAPCENVCPVNATAHSPEGINEMVYNRCVGTRYCMNNCPYKVRRFNFLDFHGEVHELRRMQFNPNVTVRMRGVMEKCTYCVQRIQYARIRARTQTTVDASGEIHERRIRAEEVTPACAQACPSEAIVFGDLNDTESRVHALAHLDRNYKLLAPVGTQPRTSYLGKIRNPNPRLA